MNQWRYACVSKVKVDGTAYFLTGFLCNVQYIVVDKNVELVGEIGIIECKEATNMEIAWINLIKYPYIVILKFNTLVKKV